MKLYEKLTTYTDVLSGKDHYQKNIPTQIETNLNPNFQLRPYQLEAFGRFKFYMESYNNRPKGVPTQLLYHMATGSGKTLIMAGLMLYLYEQGYRNFLFFVNSTNIINKTRDNFLNTKASKYLFGDSVVINNKQINIKEVDNFQAANPDDINIVFSTIQGLHMDLNTPRENSLTYDDFENEKIVLISDEAHHINAETRRGRLNQEELLAVNTWEYTVQRIFNANKQNLLLEFTATIDFNNESIAEKYQDKIIFDYPLKSFRIDGYSKEVKVLQSDIDLMDRALQAIILSQFRRKIFEKNGWLIKPVILFKSKTIRDSEEFLEKFISMIKNLKKSDLEKIKSNPNLDAVLRQIFSYFEDNGISLSNLALELKEEFSENKCISVNSKNESEQKQIAVNTLEDKDNEYRGIFAVDKLNEGWDVLNLFDIVRLYDTRHVTDGKAGKTTISEAQLIGRGARYCPFRLNEEQPLYQRKYDILNDEKDRELKICEELYYHSAYNPRYIQELHSVLQEMGIKAKETRQLNLFLKPEFKEKKFYKTGFIFKNQRKKYAREDVTGLNSSFIETIHKINLLTGYSQSSTAFEFELSSQVNRKQKDYFIKSFGLHVVKKAIAKFPEYQFSNLKKLFPSLKSVSEFIKSDDYLGKIKVEITGTEENITNLTQDDKLYITVRLLDKLREQLQSENIDYKGTTEFKPYMIKDVFGEPKTLNIANDGTTDKEFGIAQGQTSNQDLNMNLSDKDWFAFNENYGTSEEKYFVKYLDKIIDDFKKQYNEVYLLRNEKHLQIFNFNDGRAFEPDFILFLIKEKQSPALHYQVFIEPKGKHLIQLDEWKQNFLIQLQSEHKIEQLWKDRNYIIWGMPFYNETETKAEFGSTMDAFLK